MKRKKVMEAGPLMKIAVYTPPEPRDGPRARAEKSRITTAAQKLMNDKTAKGRLEMILAANFTPRDLFLTLTYRDKDLPTTRKDAQKRIRRFLRLLREYRKARGETLKYVYVTENKHGAGRFHHHVILNATARDIETFRSLWTYGDIIDIRYIGTERGAYAYWAGYMAKESGDRPVGAQMWTGSKNLAKPKVTYSYIGNDETIETPAGYSTIVKDERKEWFGGYCYIKCFRLPVYTDEKPPLQQGDPEADPGPLLSCL